jgi:hypothetical protein
MPKCVRTDVHVDHPTVFLDNVLDLHACKSKHRAIIGGFCIRNDFTYIKTEGHDGVTREVATRNDEQKVVDQIKLIS